MKQKDEKDKAALEAEDAVEVSDLTVNQIVQNEEPNIVETDLSEEVTSDETSEDKEEKIVRIRMIAPDHLVIDEREYKLLMNYQDGFNIEQLNERYSDVLDKYDYIVGDIGFEQLRLKGFFDDYRKKVAYDQKIGTLEDYLYEYCNFGCAYFVIERLEKLDDKLINTIPAHTKEKRGKVKDVKQQVKNNKNSASIKNKQNANKSGNRSKNKKNSNNRQNKNNSVAKEKQPVKNKNKSNQTNNKNRTNPSNKNNKNSTTNNRSEKNNSSSNRSFVIRQKDETK